MGDDAFCHSAFGCRNAPRVGGRLEEHDARRCAAFAHVLMRHANAATAAGGEITPNTLTRKALPRRWVFSHDLGPVAFQLFGHHLCETGQRPLTHFGARNPHDHFVVWLNHHPSIYFWRHGCRALCASLLREQWNVKTNH